MAGRYKLPWFPLDPVEMMTDRRFATLDDAQHGRALRGAYYLWVYGTWPGDGSAESKKLRLLVTPWLDGIREAQERRFNEASKRNSANAKMGWNNALDASRSQSQPLASESLPIRSRSRSRSRSREETTTIPPIPPEGFEAFWKAYPKKTARGNCEAWWKRNKPDEATLAQMLHALEWQCISADWKKEGGKYIPHPQTWLNGKRWLDEKRPGSGDDREAAKERFLASLKSNSETPNEPAY